MSISRSVVDFAQHHLISDCFYRYFFTLTYRCPSALSSRQGSDPSFASLQTQGAAPPRRARGWGALREQLRPWGGRWAKVSTPEATRGAPSRRGAALGEPSWRPGRGKRLGPGSPPPSPAGPLRRGSSPPGPASPVRSSGVPVAAAAKHRAAWPPLRPRHQTFPGAAPVSRSWMRAGRGQGRERDCSCGAMLCVG